MLSRIPCRLRVLLFGNPEQSWQEVSAKYLWLIYDPKLEQDLIARPQIMATKLRCTLTLLFLVMGQSSLANVLKPTEFNPELIMSLKADRVEKDPYETTDEYERRRLEYESRLEVKDIFIPVATYYDADYERYLAYLEFFNCDADECTRAIFDSTSYEKKYGSNAFGVLWAWKEQQGSRFQISIPNIKQNIQFNLARAAARELGEDASATLQIRVKQQIPKTSSIYSKARLGYGTSNNYEQITFQGIPVAIHFGDANNGQVIGKFQPSEPPDLTDTSQCMPLCEPIKYKVRYPSRALSRGITGECGVEFDIETDGSTSNVRLASPQGVRWLSWQTQTSIGGIGSDQACSPRGIFDKDAVKTIKKARFKPPARRLESALYLVSFEISRDR